MPQVIAMMNKEMLYYINPEQQTPEELKALLEMHPEIKFVSFMGVDFAGNDTDEKVPINLLSKISTASWKVWLLRLMVLPLFCRALLL